MSNSENKKSSFVQFAIPDSQMLRNIVGDDISINNENLVKLIKSDFLAAITKQLSELLGKDEKDLVDNMTLYSVCEEKPNIVLTFNIQLDTKSADDAKKDNDEEQIMSNLGDVDEFIVDLLMPRVEKLDEFFGDDISIHNDEFVNYVHEYFLSEMREEILQALDISPEEDNIDLDIAEIEDRGQFIYIRVSVKIDSIDTTEVIEDFLICLDTLDDCISFASSFIIESDFQNTLYKYDDKYYIYVDEYLTAKLEAIILENMGQVDFSAVGITRILEHGEVIIEDNALQKLSKIK